MNVTTAIDRFTRQLAANGRSAHTRSAYRRDLEALARWWITERADSQAILSLKLRSSPPPPPSAQSLTSARRR
ncbi:MAG: site-specific integrase [candidate division Zixibacteria bacterium]|nr:site-specific integrase [candidate division Zixibacteria bacterium]